MKPEIRQKRLQKQLEESATALKALEEYYVLNPSFILSRYKTSVESFQLRVDSLDSELEVEIEKLKQSFADRKINLTQRLEESKRRYEEEKQKKPKELVMLEIKISNIKKELEGFS